MLAEKYAALVKNRRRRNGDTILQLKEEYSRFLEHERQRKMRTRNMMASLESLEQHAAVMHAKTEHLRASRRQWDCLNARLQPKLSESFAVRRPEWPGLDLGLDQVLDLSGKKRKEEKRFVSREVENFLASINERVEAKSIGLHSAAAGDTQAKHAAASVPSDQACHEVLENLVEESPEEVQVEPYLPAQVAHFEELQVHEERVYDEPGEEAPLEHRRKSDAPAYKENQVAPLDGYQVTPLEGSQVAPSVQQFLETSISESEPTSDFQTQGDSHQEPQGPPYQPYEEPTRPLHEEPPEEPYHNNQVELYQEPQVEPYHESPVKAFEEPVITPYQEPAQVQPFEGRQEEILYERPQERNFEVSQEQPYEGPQEQPFAQERRFEGSQEQPFEGAQERPLDGSHNQEQPFAQERPLEGVQSGPIPAYQELEPAPLQDYQGAQEAPEQVGPGRMYEEASSESWAEPHAELEQQMADILRHAPTPNRPPPPPSKSGVSPSSSWGKIKNLSALRTRPASPSSSSSKSSSGSKRSSPNRSPSTSRSPRRANK
ncbi:Hypothetical predicted protein [Cloeon dipterum]|nr:Hypothetical predicted protein [Cloeon dipterum]